MAVSTVTLIAAGSAWVGLLFAAAIVGERAPGRFRRIWPSVYALSLAVYCTAWTFYGTATQTVQSGWLIPPTFVGTIVLFVIGWPLLLRVIDKAKAQSSSSIAEFIASSFGRSTALAVVVTAVAVLGMVPYIALQLKAVAASYAMLHAGAGPGDDLPAWQDITFWVALLMAVFAMLFGTRHAATAEHNGGLVLAMAVESLLKLGALLVVGGFVVFGQFNGPADLVAATAATAPARATDLGAFAVLALLGMLAMVSLPHQFHIGVVECRDRVHLNTARWLFPLYLVLVSLPIFAFARAGTLLLGDAVPSDLYVLGLPLLEGRQGLALLTFLGGLSAATGMVILASLALSIMIGNHWLAPLMLRRSWMARDDLRAPVLVQRRFGIALVLGLAYIYSRALTDNEALADIGAVSFSGLAQLAPAVLLAVLRPGLPSRAVLAGLLAGVATWSYVLLAPLAGRGGLFGDAAEATASLSTATLLSLAVNLGVVAAVARWLPRWARDDAAADRQLDPATLLSLASRFLGPERVSRFSAAQPGGTSLQDTIEHELAAVVGATSARLLLDAARRRAPAPLETVAALVDEASQQARFKHSLLEAALQNMSQGISVVDSDLRLVVWNQRYADLFAYPPGLLNAGVAVEALVRHNARRGLAGAGDPEAIVQRRLAHMRAGTPYVAERLFPDGSVIEILGTPMPGGGFVATFTDVTASRRSQAELRRAAQTLEQRVAARTGELEAAKAEAERANQAKSRFLAAVSHDLLQPINAAHLFTHALAQQVRHPEYLEAVRNIDGALSSSEALLAGILDISRLDAGGLAPRIEAFPVDEMLTHLAAEFRVLAAERGLQLRYVRSGLWVESDPQLLRRVLQNFLSNAVRYTRRGRIVLGCRRKAGSVSLVVLDTGPGIAAEDHARIFEEFRSLERGGPGLGLGLAIAERIARLLDHRLEFDSRPGRGSAFAIRVPRAAPRETVAPVVAARAPRAPALRVLVVDNDPAVLKAMQALLEGWHCTVLAAHSSAEAERIMPSRSVHLLLLDYHLDDATTGLELQRRLAAQYTGVPAIVITADHSEAVRAAVAAAGCFLLYKPLKPLALKSLMARLVPLNARRADPAAQPGPDP